MHTTTFHSEVYPDLSTATNVGPSGTSFDLVFLGRSVAVAGTVRKADGTVSVSASTGGGTIGDVALSALAQGF